MKKAAENFITVPFTSRNLDRYIARTSILRALRESLPHLNGRLLDAGCGKMPYREFVLKKSNVKEYVGLDIETAKVYDKDIKPDFTWDGKIMPFEQGSFDCAFATEVLEHCPQPEVFLKEVHRVLRPGGVFFFTVPFLWNLHEIPNDEYRYTPFSLERHLVHSGFVKVSIKATGGWHASMAQMLGLWVRRGPMSRFVKTILSLLVMPLIYFLYKKDSRTSVKFKEGVMITGLYGIATKA